MHLLPYFVPHGTTAVAWAIVLTGAGGRERAARAGITCVGSRPGDVVGLRQTGTRGWQVRFVRSYRSRYFE
jgi:hypothetical protein